MECQSCGRYRPSSEIVAVEVRRVGLVMACARCRRLMVAASRQLAPTGPR
jgi:hypothetical protein